MSDKLSEKTLNSNNDVMTGIHWGIESARWTLLWAVILSLGLLFAVGLLQIAQGAFQVLSYYWLVKTPHLYPVNVETLFWGIKLIALYLVSIWLLSLYRASSSCQAIIKRSVITGAVLGALLIGMVAVDRFVVYYYTNQIDCELPEPSSIPRSK
jgi:hypothetical protein